MDWQAPQDTYTRIPWHRKRSTKILAIILAVVSLVAILVTIVVITQWNNRPEKRLMETVNYAVSQPGTYFIKSENADIDVYVDGARYAVSATMGGVPVQAVGDANMLYLKTPEPEKLLDTLLAGESLGQFQSTIRAVVSNIKDKWLSVNLQNQTMNIAMFKQAECVVNVKSSLSGNRSVWNSFTSTYLAHPFIDILTANESTDNVTYDMKLDTETYKKFQDALDEEESNSVDTECATAKMNVAGYAEGKTVSVEIAKPQNKLNKLMITDGSGKKMTVSTDYSTKPEIVIPKDTISMEQITGNVFSSILQSYFQGR